MSLVVRADVMRKICDALGLKNVRKMDLHFAYDAVSTADVEFFLDTDQAEQLPNLVKHYVLTERK